MGTFLKILIGLAVALSLAAFIGGSLAGGSEDSPPRERIIIEDNSSPVGDEFGSEGPGRDQDPARKPPAGDGDDKGGDDEERDDASDAGDPGGVNDDDDTGEDETGDDDTGDDDD